MSGTIVLVEGNAAVVDQPQLGLSRQVLLPAYLAERVADQVGRPITLHTLEYLEAQGQGTSFVPRMLGFAHAEDRQFFEIFTSVKGLGNRRALRAMAVPPREIAGMVAAKDARGLQKLPEIGKRLAETVIAELTGKLDAFVDAGVVVEPKTGAAAAPGLKPAGPVAEAVEVLLALGQTQAEAERAIERALRGTNGTALTGEEIVAKVFGQT
ncbi:MAG TPA: Holliday junction branch migration protein RuvA [Phycisphaerales bacterium]|nr:Holliday junction branch migration protein RuvA [Phycisphaerales bacterium]